MQSASLWGWLLAACLVVLVGCCILVVDARSTLNEYQTLREHDIVMLRKEITEASLSRNEQLKVIINNNYDQLKQYMDIQIAMKARDAVNSYSPIVVNQSANPHISTNPIIQNKQGTQ